MDDLRLKELGENFTIDQHLDLKGEVCPYTFVKTKLTLEDMASGSVLSIVVDHEPATKNVPRSLAREGHVVLQVVQTADHEWTITVRKA